MKKFIVFIIFLIFTCQVSYAQTRGQLNNPLEIGTSAKVIGLGGAYVGVADDSNAIFTNPAGIGLLESFDITSMYAKLIGEYKYLTFGIALPTKLGSFGIGYVGNTVSGIPSTIYNNGRVRENGTFGAGESMGLLNYAYGNQIPDLSMYYSLVVNFKYYRQFVNTSVRSSFGIDFGVLARMDMSHRSKLVNELSVGVNLSNIYPIRMNVANGGVDTMPFQPRFGFGVNMFKRKFLFAMDYYDRGLHFGAEYQAHPLLVVRGGLNKDDIVVGLGLRVDEMTSFNQDLNFEFDYAYQFNQTPLGGDNTHFFSMTFQGMMKKPYVRLDKPTENVFTTKEKNIVFEGKCRRKSNITIFNNDLLVRDMETENDGFWQTRISLNEGKNIIKVYSGKRATAKGRGAKTLEITYTPEQETKKKKGYFN